MINRTFVKKRFKKNSKTYSAIVIWAICLSVFPIFATFIFSWLDSSAIQFDLSIEFNHAAKIFLTNTVVLSVYFSPVLIGSKKTSLLFAIVLLIPFGVSILVEYVHIAIFSARPNSGAYYAIFATHQKEAMEFFGNYMGWKQFALLVFFFTATALFSKYFQRIRWLRYTILILFLIHFILSVIYLVSRKNERYWNESPLIFSWLTYSEYKEDLRFLQLDCPQTSHPRTKNEKEIHIVVIGESTSKYHMSLYGYGRETTPYLDAMKDSLIIFRHATSPIVHTVEAIQSLLHHRTCFTLIDSVKTLGYETAWLSNQNVAGQNETPITQIAGKADRKFWASPGGNTSYDENILPPLQKELEADHSKIIFLHLAGTHIEYYRRYPRAFSKFREKVGSPFGPHADALINHYDNAVLYQDHLLRQIIELVEKENHPATVTYLSDHGDEVFDFRNFHGHSQARISEFMRDIPLLFYANNDYRDAYENVLGSITNQSAHSIEIDEVNKLLYALANHNPLKQNQHKTTVIDTPRLETSVSGKESSFLFADRTWVHRVNGVERYRELQGHFKGFEIDLVYDGKDVLVGHPGANHKPIPIKSFFQTIQPERNTFWWCDLKNFSTDNSVAILKEITGICAAFNLDQTAFLLETTSPKLVSIIEKNGFYASYYLPDMSRMNLDNRESTLQEIKNVVAQNEIKMISQSVENYTLMKAHFPDLKKALWFLTMEYNEENRKRVNTVLKNDSTIQIALVNYPSDSWQ